MSRRDWKRVRAHSLVHALRLCKEFAQQRPTKPLSVARIADLMGESEDSLYKWLANGRMPANLIPAYENVCGCHFVSDWLAASAGRMVIEMPTGRRVGDEELLALNTGLATALPLLKAFYQAPQAADLDATLESLRQHMEQVAFHHRNVAQYATPELEF